MSPLERPPVSALAAPQCLPISLEREIMTSRHHLKVHRSVGELRLQRFHCILDPLERKVPSSCRHQNVNSSLWHDSNVRLSGDETGHLFLFSVRLVLGNLFLRLERN